MGAETLALARSLSILLSLHFTHRAQRRRHHGLADRGERAEHGQRKVNDLLDDGVGGQGGGAQGRGGVGGAQDRGRDRAHAGRQGGPRLQQLHRRAQGGWAGQVGRPQQATGQEGAHHGGRADRRARRGRGRRPGQGRARAGEERDVQRQVHPVLGGARGQRGGRVPVAAEGAVGHKQGQRGGGGQGAGAQVRGGGGGDVRARRQGGQQGRRGQPQGGPDRNARAQRHPQPPRRRGGRPRPVAFGLRRRDGGRGHHQQEGKQDGRKKVDQVGQAQGGQGGCPQAPAHQGRVHHLHGRLQEDGGQGGEEQARDLAV